MKLEFISGTVDAFSTSDYIFVKLFARNTQYRYDRVIDKIDAEYREICFTFLELCDN